MKRIVYYSLVFVILTALITFPEIGTGAVIKSLKRIVSDIIPSLFPFMVFSQIATEAASTKKSKSSRFRILKLPAESLPLIFIGNVCGFPIGAKNAASLKSSGVLTEDEALRFALISNNAGLPFVLSFAGLHLFSNKKAGILFYLSQLAATFIIYLLLICKRKTGLYSYSDTANYPNDENKQLSRKTLTETFIDAVADGALSVVRITAFICIFTVIFEYLSEVLDFFNTPTFVKALISSFLEISNGCIESSSLKGPASYVICSFAIGFSGISVLLQSFTFLQKEKINIFLFTVYKLLQGLVSALITFVFVKFAPDVTKASNISLSANNTYVLLSLICGIIIILYFLVFIKKTALNLIRKHEKA